MFRVRLTAEARVGQAGGRQVFMARALLTAGGFRLQPEASKAPSEGLSFDVGVVRVETGRQDPLSRRPRFLTS